MKRYFIPVFLLIAGSVAAQNKQAATPSAGLRFNIPTQKAVFTYRGNFATHHDTVLYMRDTFIRNRTFSLIKLGAGKVVQVPPGSIKLINAQPASSVLYGELAKSQ